MVDYKHNQHKIIRIISGTKKGMDVYGCGAGESGSSIYLIEDACTIHTLHVN